MQFHIPFTISKIDKLKSKSKPFQKIIRTKRNSQLKEYLDSSDSSLSPEEFKAITIRSFFITFVFIYIISTILLFYFNIRRFYLFSFILALAFSLFVFTSQRIYPKVYNNRRQRDIEKNLIPALEDMLVQLTSGIPLFNILTNISYSDYGELSKEFRKAVKEINAGYPQVNVLQKIGERNSSVYFKRTLWQLSNGMRAGSDISIVIKESIKSLNEEQLIQIQNYGNKLNPLIMFYMLFGVILPALAITFLTIISSMIGLSKPITTTLFIVMFVFITLFQVSFIGIIKSTRPSLL